MEGRGLEIQCIFLGEQNAAHNNKLPLQSFVRDQEVKEMSDRAVNTYINKIQLTGTSGNLEILTKMDFCSAG